MYSSIEKDYRKIEMLDNLIYSWGSIGIGVLSSFISHYFVDTEYVLGIMILSMLIYASILIVLDYKKYLSKEEMKLNFSVARDLYRSKAEEKRIGKFLMILRAYNINTKVKIKMLMDYYNSKKAIRIEYSFLGWVVSISLTLASFIEIAYDKEAKIIDYDKLAVIFGSTLGFIIIFIIFYLIFKKFVNELRLSKEKLNSYLLDDLTEIYINFDEYDYQLNKKEKQKDLTSNS